MARLSLPLSERFDASFGHLRRPPVCHYFSSTPPWSPLRRQPHIGLPSRSWSPVSRMTGMPCFGRRLRAATPLARRFKRLRDRSLSLRRFCGVPPPTPSSPKNLDGRSLPRSEHKSVTAGATPFIRDRCCGGNTPRRPYEGSQTYRTEDLGTLHTKRICTRWQLVRP